MLGTLEVHKDGGDGKSESHNETLKLSLNEIASTEIPIISANCS